MMVAAHSRDLAAAVECGLRTGHVARPDEHGPGTGETAPTIRVDVAGNDLMNVAEKLGA
jgi:2-haloacid dehalogenase